MPLRTDAGKALRQIERRDPQGAQQYRAELKYFHVPQRVILGFTLTAAQLVRIGKTVQEAHQGSPSDYALAPPYTPPPTPHALPPT